MEFFQLLFFSPPPILIVNQPTKTDSGGIDIFLFCRRSFAEKGLIANSFETKLYAKVCGGIHKEIEEGEQELKIGIPRSFFFFFQGHFRSLTHPSLVRVTVTVLLYPLFSPGEDEGGGVCFASR